MLRGDRLTEEERVRGMREEGAGSEEVNRGVGEGE